MSTWGKVPVKGKVHCCAECGEPLLFVPHKRCLLSPHEHAALLRRTAAHAATSPPCACAEPPDCFDAVGCLCPQPCMLWRDDGIHCALCDGQVEWAACRPPTVLWRGTRPPRSRRGQAAGRAPRSPRLKAVRAEVGRG